MRSWAQPNPASTARLSPPAEVESVVIGGGIAGLSTALYLARAGRDVLVLDRGDPWGESSGANAGTVVLFVLPPAVLPMTFRALALWPALGAEAGGQSLFQRSGGLCIAMSPEEDRALRSWFETQKAHGVVADFLEGAALRDFAPWLGPGVSSAAHCAEDGFVSPLQAGPAMIGLVQDAGIRLLPHTPVTGIGPAGAGWRITTPTGELRCRDIAIAAGAWSGQVSALCGVGLRVFVDVNMLAATEPAPPVLDRVVTHIGGSLSLKQFDNGTCLIGGGWQGKGSLRAATRAVHGENLLQNLAFAARAVPALCDTRLTRAWAGYEGVAADSLPLFGPLPGRAGIFVAACARGGFLLGPALGYHLAELMTEGRCSLPIAAYGPARAAQTA
ncbi:MAG: FAD-binding oxidoreductase [Rhodospirillaceae bacterium]|jgi:glycine/D-amino acid oxidase-like deaminating enzyme|nr:FAD-binding oxidoreductase [Rhodospirillaceae bacterium]